MKLEWSQQIFEKVLEILWKSAQCKPSCLIWKDKGADMFVFALFWNKKLCKLHKKKVWWTPKSFHEFRDFISCQDGWELTVNWGKRERRKGSSLKIWWCARLCLVEWGKNIQRNLLPYLTLFKCSPPKCIFASQWIVASILSIAHKIHSENVYLEMSQELTF